MKQNDKGFSLVELLVSIVILTVIMIPVLDNIVMSSRMNKSAREKQDVASLAGNLLETVKIQPDISSLAKDLLYEQGQTYEELFPGMDVSRVNVSQGEYTDGRYHVLQHNCLIKQEDGSYLFSENQEGIYTFAVNSLSYNGKSYDALITYDASTYAETEESINNKELPVLSSVAAKENAVITEGYSDTWAASSLKHSYNQWFNTYRQGENHVTNDEIAENMTREFILTVSYHEAKGKYVADGKILYTLKDTLIPALEQYASYRQFENTIFHSEFETLSNVYLFYKPDLTHKTDMITFQNQLPKEKADMTLYLIAQNQTGTDFEEAMKSYQPVFHLTESAEQTINQKKVYFTTIKNNIGLENPGSSTNLDPMAEGNIEGLVEKENKTRLYEVTIGIYKPDESHRYLEENLLTTMSSTKGAE